MTPAPEQGEEPWTYPRVGELAPSGAAYVTGVWMGPGNVLLSQGGQNPVAMTNGQEMRLGS